MERTNTQKHSLVDGFLGYTNKRDVTNLDSRYLIVGSKNVLINDGEKISARPGYTLDGPANSALTPILSSYDWINSSGSERNLRSYYDKLEYRSVDSNGAVTYRTLMSGLTDSVEFQFTEWWDNTEKIDLLLFVNGSTNMYMWSGGVTTFASATTNTITKEGTTSWGEERFLVGGTRQVVIDGTTYTYTGGESTTTLTGVTPDPTLTVHVPGAIVHQAVRVTANTPASGFNNSVIATLNNQVYVGDLTKRTVYVSKNTDYTDYTFSATRSPGEGAILTLDGTVVGFAVQENAMYISAGKDFWYQTKFTLSSDNTKEALTVDRLKTGPQQAAQSQNLIGNIKNSIVFISNEPTFDTLGRVENINTPNAKPLSDPIKADFDNYDFTGGHIKYFKNKTYISVPQESLYLIYDHERQYWQPPQISPISRFAIIDGELYGHSSATPQTFKLNDESTGTDNGAPIDCVARFAYRNYGHRDWRKVFDEHFTEGYIKSNTTLTLTLYYDFAGFTTIIEKDILGNDSAILFQPATDVSLGKNPLGSEPLGSSLDTLDELSKFRVIHELEKFDFYELLVQYESNQEDAGWQLIAQGGNVMLSPTDNFDIKQ